jgi:hypothetical protein
MAPGVVNGFSGASRKAGRMRPMNRIFRHGLQVAAVCLASVAAAHDIDLHVSPVDPRGAELAGIASRGQRQVEKFFHARFPEVVHLTVVNNRAEFNAAFPAAWGMNQTECWMVGVGVADFLVLLSPSAWQRDACDHDPGDPREVQRIVTHELVHVFHGQRNPSRDFTGADEVGWFVEGLAVLAAGQLDRQRLADTVDAVRAGDVPKTLNETWYGPQRYGRAGSVVRFLDEKYGRKMLVALLPVTKQSDLLRQLGVTEDQLLQDWRAWLLSRPLKSMTPG